MNESDLNNLTADIINAAIIVHNELGPGLLENVYKQCLKVVLQEKGYKVVVEKPLPIVFRGDVIANEGYRLDLLVEDTVIVEIKSVIELNPVHKKQLLTHLKLSNITCGLLINFNVARIKDGIKRIRNGVLCENSGRYALRIFAVWAKIPMQSFLLLVPLRLCEK